MASLQHRLASLSGWLAACSIAAVLGAQPASAAYVEVSDVVATSAVIPAFNQVIGHAGVRVTADSLFYEGRLKTTIAGAGLSFAAIGADAKYANVLYAGSLDAGITRTNRFGTDTLDVDSATPALSLTQTQTGYVDFSFYKDSAAGLLQFSNATGDNAGGASVLFAFLDAADNVVARATNRLLFAFNDAYRGDHEFDDMVGVITVTPIPGAVWLFGAGAAGLALLRRRARQSGARAWHQSGIS